MATRMLQRRGTAAEWAAANPVLGDGEVGVERDTGIVKIGDGVAAWNALTNAYRRFVDSVAKAGDTMTGNLTILKDNAALLLQETLTDRLQVKVDTGTQYIQVDDELHITAIDTPATMKNLRAGQIFDSGNRVYSASNPQPATNPFAVIDALGDLLVGSGPDAVARLAKGSNGQVLTISAGGVVNWQTPVDASTKVSKTGDTMTGVLVINPTVDSEALVVRRGVAGQTNSIQEWRSETGSWLARISPVGGLYAAGVYDGGNRVYSAANPPPASGAMINQTFRGLVSSQWNGSSYPSTTNVTISSVNTAKSQLRYLSANTMGQNQRSTLRLTSATNIEMNQNANTTVEVSYELTEWT